jgi:hypothetical protein
MILLRYVKKWVFQTLGKWKVKKRFKALTAFFPLVYLVLGESGLVTAGLFMYKHLLHVGFCSQTYA